MVPQRSNDFDIWGEEHTVDIYDVQLKFDGVIMSKKTPLIHFPSDSFFQAFCATTSRPWTLEMVS